LVLWYHQIAVSDPAIAREDIDTAEAFLSVLDPTNSRWVKDIRDWVFRGHADLAWKLVPGILRCDGTLEPWMKFLTARERIYAADGRLRDYMRTYAEFNAIKEFMVAADRAGHPIPDDSQALRSARDLNALLVSAAKNRGVPPSKPWPPQELLSIVALAQHSGLLTRLLDWSRRARVAAYHAAERVVFGGEAPRSERMVVWALRHPMIEWGWGEGTADADLVRIVTAPQATNPYLAAQAGLFTLVRHHHEDVPFDALLEERMAKGVPEYLSGGLPAMWRLSLPRSQAPRLLRLLGLDGISAATVFPGLPGVARSLEEQRRWEY
jgi:FRG domain